MEEMDYEKLVIGAKELGVELTPFQVDQLASFHALLMDWNRKMNLTRISPEETLSKHFLDSLTLGAIPDFTGEGRLIDVGTGAGFPGIPLKIAFPSLDVTLMDATRKKLTFLESVIDTLQLREVRIAHSRAEDAGKDPLHRQRYDWVVARAVAHMPQLMEWLLPLAKHGGRVVGMKSSNAREEIAQSLEVIHRLGGSDTEIIEVKIPNEPLTRLLAVVRVNRASARDRSSGGKYTESTGKGITKSVHYKRRKGSEHGR
jgi:16S rRNA (guanine527-N7)-methyltransferase